MSNENKSNVEDLVKLDLIIKKLDSIEANIFKLIEDKLSAFRGEFTRLVDDQFRNLKEYMDKKIMVIKDELNDKIEDHEVRLTAVEEQLGVPDLNKNKHIFNTSCCSPSIKFILIMAGVVLINATCLILIVLNKG